MEFRSRHWHPQGCYFEVQLSSGELAISFLQTSTVTGKHNQFVIRFATRCGLNFKIDDKEHVTWQLFVRQLYNYSFHSL